MCVNRSAKSLNTFKKSGTTDVIISSDYLADNVINFIPLNIYISIKDLLWNILYMS